MTKLVKSLGEIIRNVDTLHQYGLSNGAQRSFHYSQIKNGKVFVAVRSEAEVRFAPSKFAGYADNDLSHEVNLKSRDGSRTNDVIKSLAGAPIEKGHIEYTAIDKQYILYCRKFEVVPSKHKKLRRYWIICKSEDHEPATFEQDPSMFVTNAIKVLPGRPWHQKAATRASVDVQPGRELYVACISDRHGVTFKVGSGKSEDRIKELNCYRRPSQGEIAWAFVEGMRHEFPTFEQARQAEDYILDSAHRLGFGSSDHGEFLIHIEVSLLRSLFFEAVTIAST